MTQNLDNSAVPPSAAGAPEANFSFSSPRVVVTPEMLSAGLAVYEEFRDSFAPSQILEAVYKAMDEARPVGSCAEHEVASRPPGAEGC
jgi:hypothetical protein